MLNPTRLVRSTISRFVNARLRFEAYAGGRVVTGRDVEGLHLVNFSGQNKVGRGTVFAGDVAVGFATTIGANCYLHGPISLGNYCQLGPAVGMYGKNHPMQYMTSYINRILLDGQLKHLSEVKAVAMGHDVWVGHGAIITPGVSVGNGAVIGAGSVVTRDVPPFSIVAGCPAKVLRPRFSETIKEAIEQLAWWDYSPEALEHIESVFAVDMKHDPQHALELLHSAQDKLKASVVIGLRSGFD